MEQKGQEIQEATGASRRVSQGFPCLVCVVAAGLWTPCRVCLCASHQERQVGVESGPRRRREPREDPGEVWAAPNRPRPGRALGTGGAVACRAHSSGAARQSLVFSPRCPASSASPPPPPGAAIAWEPREEETRRGGGGRSARGCAERGRRSARLGSRGRVCAPGQRAAGWRTRDPSAPPGLSRGASVAAAQTHTHPAPPSAPRVPAAPAGRHCASGSGIQRQVRGWCGSRRTS